MEKWAKRWYKGFLKAFDVHSINLFPDVILKPLKVMQKIIMFIVFCLGLIGILFSLAVFKGEPQAGMEYMEPMMWGVTIFLDIYLLTLIARLHSVYALINKIIARITTKFNNANGS